MSGGRCVVPNCKSYRNRKGQDRGIKFHKFPSNKKLRRQLRYCIKLISEFKINKYTTVCSNHFKTEDYVITSYSYTGEFIQNIQNK